MRIVLAWQRRHRRICQNFVMYREALVGLVCIMNFGGIPMGLDHIMDFGGIAMGLDHIMEFGGIKKGFMRTKIQLQFKLIIWSYEL